MFVIKYCSRFGCIAECEFVTFYVPYFPVSPITLYVRLSRRLVCFCQSLTEINIGVQQLWLGGVVVRALDLRLEIAGSIPATALSSATLDKLFTHIVQRL